MTDAERIQGIMINYRKMKTCMYSFLIRDVVLCSGHGYGKNSCEYINDCRICELDYYTRVLK